MLPLRRHADFHRPNGIRPSTVTWHFLCESSPSSRALEADSWDPDSSAGIPSALAKLIPTAGTSYYSDNETATSSDFRSGTTFEPSTGDPGEDTSTSSRAAFLAKTSAPPVPVQVFPGSVLAWRSKCSESLKRLGLVLSSRKTVRTCVPVDSAPYSPHLPSWGTTFAGLCWELGTSARTIDGTACGYWPTPTCQGSEGSPYMQRHHEHYRRMALEIAMLPTPTATLYGSNGSGWAWTNGRTGKRRGSLEKRTGGVNLALREWMMGWPVGWTALEPLETAKYQLWLRTHGIY